MTCTNGKPEASCRTGGYAVVCGQGPPYAAGCAKYVPKLITPVARLQGMVDGACDNFPYLELQGRTFGAPGLTAWR